jgi:hypothetical protein
MRILANHGADKRFAFLRGRWGQSWKAIKAQTRMEMAKARVASSSKHVQGSLGGLEAYGDSDSDGDTVDEPVKEAKAEMRHSEGGTLSEGLTTQVGPSRESEEAIQEARRARAKEWARKRRALEADQG